MATGKRTLAVNCPVTRGAASGPVWVPVVIEAYPGQVVIRAGSPEMVTQLELDAINCLKNTLVAANGSGLTVSTIEDSSRCSTGKSNRKTTRILIKAS